MTNRAIIEDIFSHNNQIISYVKTVEDNFYINYYYNYLDYKSINKLKLILKTIAVRLDTRVDYTFADDCLVVMVAKKQNETLYFDNYLGWIPRNKDYVFLGVNQQGDSIYEKVQDIKSLLIGGSSGSGKSNLLHQLILSYLFLNDHNYIMIIDMKANEFTRYSDKIFGNRLVLPVAYTYEKAFETIVAFRNIIKNRFEEMMKKEQRFSSEPPVLLVIDEYAQLFQDNEQKKKINSLISQCASLGRASNCYLFLATQHPTNENITNTIRANMQSRIVLKCMNTQQSHNLLGTPEATTLQHAGDSIIHIDGKKPIKAKTTYVSDEVLNDATKKGKIYC